MQRRIGLTDKYGKEIREGDIYHQGDKNILYVVVYRDGSFIGKQIGSSSYAGIEHFLENIEVIGSIDENTKIDAQFDEIVKQERLLIVEEV